MQTALSRVFKFKYVLGIGGIEILFSQDINYINV